MKMFGFLTLLLATVLMSGCGDTASNSGGDKGGSGTMDNSDKGASNQTPAVNTVANTVSYCACGEIKGSDNCCADGAEKCECGKIAGSPLCCVEIPDDLKDQDFCACGWAKGSENCCSKDGEVCEACGMHKGSTLCCKIVKK